MRVAGLQDLPLKLVQVTGMLSVVHCYSVCHPQLICVWPELDSAFSIIHTDIMAYE